MLIKAASHQKGVGLIEVLVAIFILSGGLMGLAALQTKSLRFNHEAYMRTVASILSSDMIDRLRANSEEALATNNYRFTLGQNTSGDADACEVAACSESALADYDYKQWSDEIASQLPGGIGSVTPGTINAAGWREYSIVIQFNSISVDKKSDNATTSSFTYRTRI